MKLSEALLRVAAAEVGVSEVGFANCGPRVDQYKAATWMDNPKQGFPWCAAFVCWCVREAMKLANVKETPTFKRPQTAGAWDFENWSLKQDDSTSTARPVRANMIRPGDIVIFKFSHIGIATSTTSLRGEIKTIEGNTNSAGSRDGGGVYRKIRNISDIRCRIRFTI